SAAGTGSATRGFWRGFGEFSMAGRAPASSSMGSTRIVCPLYSTVSVAWRTSCSRMSLGSEDFLGCDNRVAVNRDGVFYFVRVTACECHHHWNVAGSCYFEHQLVTPSQPFNRKRQASKLIFAVGIGSGDVADQFRIELP